MTRPDIAQRAREAEGDDLPRYADLRDGGLVDDDRPTITPLRVFLLIAAALTALALALALAPRVATMPPDPAAGCNSDGGC